MKLFAIHAIGGSNALDRNLASYLRPDYFLYKISPSIKLFTSSEDIKIEHLASEYISNIEKRSDPPYVIIAFCATGFIALEMAKVFSASQTLQGMLWINPPNIFTDFKKRYLLDNWQELQDTRLKEKIAKGISKEEALRQLSVSGKIIKALMDYKLSDIDFRNLYIFHPTDSPTNYFDIFDFDIFDENRGLMKFLKNAEIIFLKGEHGRLGEDPYCKLLAQEVKEVLGRL